MAGIAKSLDAYQGLVIPDERCTWSAYDEDNSTNTQAGPRPMTPKPDQSTALAWAASGESDGTSYDLRVQVGGCPGLDDATWLWKPSSSASNQWRGWDPPVALTGWAIVDNDTAANAYLYRNGLRCTDGTVLYAAQYHSQQVVVQQMLPGTSTWTRISVYDKGSAYAQGAHPTLVSLPDGRVLLFFLVEAGTTSQLRMYYSDDQGTTWTMGQRAALRTAIDRSTYTVTRMRVVRVGGELLLLVSVVDTSLTCDDVVLQYASQDAGASWTLIDTWAGADYTTSGTLFEAVAVGDTFVVAYLRGVDDGAGAADAIPCVRRIGSAWSPLSEAEDIEARGGSTAPIWGVRSGGNFTASTRSAQGLTICADDDGTLYLFGRDTANNYDGLVVVSRDGGLSWVGLGSSGAPSGYAVWWQAGADDGHPQGLAAVAVGGRILMGYAPVGSTANDDSFFVAQLGGYTDVELPRINAAGRPTDRITWGLVYWPTDIPDAVGTAWTRATTGAPTYTITGALLYLVQLAGEEVYWYHEAAGDIEDGVVVEVDVHALTGTAYVKVVVSDGADGYALTVKVNATQVVVRDVEAGSDIATAALTTDEATFCSIRVVVNNPTGAGAGNDGRCKVWKRAAGLAAVRDWDLVTSSTTLHTGVHATNRVSFGGVLGAATLKFAPVRVSIGGDEVGLGLIGQDNPDDLQGRAMGAVPVEGPTGLYFRAEAGPGYRGDTWTMTSAYDHGVELLHYDVSRSPAERWRSTNNAAAATFAWSFNSAEDEMPQGSILAFYLGGINFRTAELYGRVAGVYVKIADISAVVGTTLKFARYGNTVRPDPNSGANAGYLFENGCAGWTWRQNSGGGVTPVYRRIRSNTAGAWAPGSHRLPHLYLEDAAATDDTSGSDGELWSNQVLILVQDAAQYSGFRLRVPAQGTAEGYREIGIAFPGHLHLFGQSPSWSRELGWTSTAEVTTSRRGARRVRAPAAVRRRVSFSWDEPVDTSELFTASAVLPSWGAGYTSGPGATTPADTVLGMGGIFARLQGAKVPVVYCPRIEPASSSSADITITSPAKLYYGAIASTEFLANQSMGDECADPGEMLRGGRVTIEEEL